MLMAKQAAHLAAMEGFSFGDGELWHNFIYHAVEVLEPVIVLYPRQKPRE